MQCVSDALFKIAMLARCRIVPLHCCLVVFTKNCCKNADFRTDLKKSGLKFRGLKSYPYAYISPQ